MICTVTKGSILKYQNLGWNLRIHTVVLRSTPDSQDLQGVPRIHIGIPKTTLSPYDSHQSPRIHTETLRSTLQSQNSHWSKGMYNKISESILEFWEPHWYPYYNPLQSDQHEILRSTLKDQDSQWSSTIYTSSQLMRGVVHCEGRGRDSWRVRVHGLLFNHLETQLLGLICFYNISENFS